MLQLNGGQPWIDKSTTIVLPWIVAPNVYPHISAALCIPSTAITVSRTHAASNPHALDSSFNGITGIDFAKTTAGLSNSMPLIPLLLILLETSGLDVPSSPLAPADFSA